MVIEVKAGREIGLERFFRTNKVIDVTVNARPAPFLMYVDRTGLGGFFSSQEFRPPPPAVLYPTIKLESVAVSPTDVRTFLGSPRKVHSDFRAKLVLRDSAVDLDAALSLEDPDPPPLASFSSSIDLARSVATAGAEFVVGDGAGDAVPSSLLLQSLRPLLRDGANAVTFTVSSLLQGPRTVSAVLYLWQSRVRVAVSDVDGTVTSSDILGHFLPPMGRDWTHPGLVHLYARIAAAGLKLLYLTSRPIGEAAVTRQLLARIRQDGVALPEGPILMCPDFVLAAISREIKHLPQEFKIPVLRDTLRLFEPHNPFAFGLGNRISDVLSYREIGLSDRQMILFDTAHRVSAPDGKVLFASIRELTPHIEQLLADCGAIDPHEL
jgi:phosphatidate phosphatase LPIN